MEIGTAFLYGALGVGVFILGRFVEKKFSGKNTTQNEIIKKLGDIGGIKLGKNDMESILSLLKRTTTGGNKGEVEREIPLDMSISKRFEEMEQKSRLLSRAVVLFRRKSDDIWADVRDKYNLHSVNQLQVTEDYKKIKIMK